VLDLTATSRPSARKARWTCPIDALAQGSASNDANRRSIGAPSSFSTVLRIASGDDVGAAARSLVSAVSYASRWASGTMPST